MVTFTFELTTYAQEAGVSGLSRGHLTISGATNTITSKGHIPDQSMMVFMSIVDLLDGARQFLQTPGQKQYNFVGTGCSFQFTIKRTKGDKLLISNPTNVIDTVSVKDFVQAIWQGTQAFLKAYESHLSATDMVADDLYHAVQDFEETVL